jgi:colanic acid biosynthesis glycosyl transferase WcaI
VSVPSKTYSIMAAGRPVIAAIDPGTAVPTILEASGGGVSVPPDDPEAFVAAVRDLVEHPGAARRMGTLGREWVVREASPGAVGAAYDTLVRTLAGEGPRPPKGSRRR